MAGSFFNSINLFELFVASCNRQLYINSALSTIYSDNSGPPLGRVRSKIEAVSVVDGATYPKQLSASFLNHKKKFFFLNTRRLSSEISNAN